MAGSKHHDHPEAQLVGLIASGKHKDAEALYRPMCAARKAAYGEESGETYDDMFRLALLLLLGRKHEEAEGLLRKVVKHYKEREGLGPLHEKYVKSVNALGEALDGQGKHNEAVDVYFGISENKDKYAAKAHEELLRGVDSFARMLAGQDMLKEADGAGCLMVYERKELLGQDHLDTLMGMHTLAGIKFKRKQYHVAVALYETAYQGTRRRCGDRHPDTTKFLEDLQAAREKAKDTSPWVEALWRFLP